MLLQRVFYLKHFLYSSGHKKKEIERGQIFVPSPKRYMYIPWVFCIFYGKIHRMYV